MRRAKSGPALFEVLSKEHNVGSDTLDVPQWWSSDRTDAHLKPEGLAAAGQETGVSRGGGKPKPGLPVSGRQGESAPFFEIIAGRVCVSLTSAAAAAVVFIAMVTVLVGYELGRRSGDSSGFGRGYEAGRVSYAAEAVDEIELARAQPPATHLTRSLRVGGAAAGQAEVIAGDRVAASGSAEWIRDFTYIVAQEFAAGRTEDAQRAREYLAARGVATALVAMSNGAAQLITEQGFNLKDSTQKQLAERLLVQEHEIGSQYFASGGGYRLRGYFRTLKGDTW